MHDRVDHRLDSPWQPMPAHGNQARAWRRHVGCGPTHEETACRPGRGRNPVRWPATEKQGAAQLFPLSFPFAFPFPLLFVFPFAFPLLSVFPFPFPLLPLALLLAALAGALGVFAPLVA